MRGALGAASAARGGAGGRDRALDRRQADREGRSLAAAFARRPDRAVVHLDQAARQCQADAQPAALAGEAALALDEQVEHALDQLGRHAFAAVAHLDDRGAALGPHRDVDPAARRRVLQGVVEQVGHDLLDPGAVGVHPDLLQVALDLVVQEAIAAAPGLDHRRHHRGQVERLALQPDLAAGDAPDLEQVVHQARHLLDLAGEDRADGLDHVGPARRRLEQVRGVRHRGERVAQLVAEHRQELVLGAVGGAQRLLGRLLPVLALADRRSRLFERAHQLAQLVHRAGIGQGERLALAERRRRLGNRADRPRQAARRATRRTTGRGRRRPRSRPRAATGSAGWCRRCWSAPTSTPPSGWTRNAGRCGRRRCRRAARRGSSRLLGDSIAWRSDGLANALPKPGAGRRATNRKLPSITATAHSGGNFCRSTIWPTVAGSTTAESTSSTRSPRTTGTRIANSGRFGTSLRTISPTVNERERAASRIVAVSAGRCSDPPAGASRFITNSPVSARDTRKLTQSPLRASRARSASARNASRSPRSRLGERASTSSGVAEARSSDSIAVISERARSLMARSSVAFSRSTST